AFGIGLGVFLVVLGYRTYERRRHFSLVFLGGGIAVFYITAFAAFQRLAIVPHAYAFGFMVLVTLFALSLSLKQNDSVLSLLGAIGGFGTPFMLYTGSGDIPALMFYTCLLIAATVAIYFYRGWRSLLWVTVLAGWTVIIIALESGVRSVYVPSLVDQQAVQAGVLFTLIAFWMVPAAREIARSKSPTRWSDPPVGVLLKDAHPQFRDFLRGVAHWLAVSTPLIALAISHAVWPDLTDTIWGWITLVGAVVYWAAAAGLYRIGEVKNLAYTHVLVGILLLTIALTFFFKGDTLMFVVATEAIILHLIAHRTEDRGIMIGANALFTLAAFAVLLRLFAPQTGSQPVFNQMALADIWTIAGAMGLSFVFRSDLMKRIYFLAAYVALAAWLNRELDGNLLFFLITVQVFALHLLTYRGTDVVLRTASHMFSLLFGFWLVGRMAGRDSHLTAVFCTYAGVNLLGIVVAAVASRLTQVRTERFWYGLAAHLLLMGWLLSELSTLPEGQGYVTIAWGVLGAILLIFGLRRNDHRLRLVALGTLFAVVGKLFLIDLAHIEAIFRILLFMGFGGVFLALSYYFRSLWKSDSSETGNRT
ncbi:MAG: DUF2339 domain-containing protein, partial [Candidatus Zixiibacteriota bacterium]